MTPRPPWPHRLVGNHYVLIFYKAVGAPKVTMRYGDCVTTMERHENGVTQVTTKKRHKRTAA